MGGLGGFDLGEIYGHKTDEGLKGKLPPSLIRGQRGKSLALGVCKHFVAQPGGYAMPANIAGDLVAPMPHRGGCHLSRATLRPNTQSLKLPRHLLMGVRWTQYRLQKALDGSRRMPL